MRYTSNWIFDHYKIPSEFNYAEIVLIENTFFSEEVTYYSLGTEKGEESVLIYDGLNDEAIMEKRTALSKNRKFLVVRGLRDYSIIDKLPREQFLHSLGVLTQNDLYEGLNWATRVRNVLYDRFYFDFQDPARIEYEFDHGTGEYEQKYYNDPDVENENELKRKQLHCVRIFLADHGVMIYHGLHIENESEFESSVSSVYNNGGQLVLVPLTYSEDNENISTEDDKEHFEIVDDIEYNNTLFKMDQFFINVDKLVKEKYPLSSIEPLTLHYNNIYYDIKSGNKHIIVRFGKDDNIYEIVGPSTISSIKNLADKVYFKHIVNVIKFRCKEFYGYNIGSNEYE